MAEMGAAPVGPAEMVGAMRTFILPQRRSFKPDDCDQLRDILRREEGIFVHALSFSANLLLLLSAQAYVSEDEVVRFAQVLDARGWPSR